jgi:hypothetical protein
VFSDNEVEFHIRVRVFCAEGVHEPHLVARWYRRQLPILCMAGDVRSVDAVARKHRFIQAMEHGAAQDAVNALDSRAPGWDLYSVHFDNRLEVVNT